MMRKVVTIFLALSMILTVLPVSFSDFTGDGNKGDASGSGLTNAKYTWNESQQGYRFYVVDKDLNLVSNILDLTLVPFNAHAYPTTKPVLILKGTLGKGNGAYYQESFEKFYENNKDLFGYLGTNAYPKGLLEWNGSLGKFEAKGEELTKYFLSGQGSIGLPTQKSESLYVPDPIGDTSGAVIVYTPSPETGGGGANAGGSKGGKKDGFGGGNTGGTTIGGGVMPPPSGEFVGTKLSPMYGVPYDTKLKGIPNDQKVRDIVRNIISARVVNPGLSAFSGNVALYKEFLRLRGNQLDKFLNKIMGLRGRSIDFHPSYHFWHFES